MSRIWCTSEATKHGGDSGYSRFSVSMMCQGRGGQQPRRAEVAGLFYSLIESAKLVGINMQRMADQT